MKLTELWKKKGKPTISFEFFPAHNEKAGAKLDKVIDELAALGPDFVSVTFGAGGSTREGSYNLAAKLKNQKGLEVVPYFACWGLGPDDISAVVDRYGELGVDNMLAVRGDEPRETEGFKPHPESFGHATELLAFLRPKYKLCLGAAGYPEGHVQAQSKDKDIFYLKKKQENGAEFIIANYCYDNRYFFDFTERAREMGVDVPILPGIMPIFSVKMMENLASICGATITDEVRKGVGAIGEDDKEGLVDFGIRFAVKQCVELMENGAPGLHLYTIDRAESAARIVKELRASGLL